MVIANIAAAVSTFGANAKSKLASPAISGAPEDQLRAPLETLMATLTELCGLPPGSVHLIGETSLEQAQFPMIREVPPSELPDATRQAT